MIRQKVNKSGIEHLQFFLENAKNIDNLYLEVLVIGKCTYW
jgi:hypothetical protein